MKDYLKALGNHPKIIKALGAIGGNSRNDLLRRIHLTFTEDYSRLFFDVISDSHLEGLLRNPPVSNAVFDIFQQRMMLPTDSLLDFILACPSKTVSRDLDSKLLEIESGNFDIKNQVHLELEYSKYRLIFDKKRFYQYKAHFRLYGTHHIFLLDD